jgi:protoporphyrinogen oxidase
MKIGIIGGGLTGLTIAANLNHDFEVLEKNDKCGGLCRSFSEQGFTFDIGGHIFFSRNKEILSDLISLLEGNEIEGVRNNKIFFKGRFVKYPFENGLSELPKQDTFECIYHYINNPFSKQKPTNFKEWIYHTFGKGIAEKYLVPYNRKIWNFDLSRMGLHWIEGRVPKPPLKDVLKSAIGISTEGYKEQLHFRYPKKGGIAAIISSLEERASKKGDIIKNFDVKHIRKEGAYWVVSDGKNEKRFDKIISTMPLNELVTCLEDAPKNVIDSASALRYNSLVLVMIGLEGMSKDYTAIYFPDEGVLYNRVCFMNTFSRFNSPEGKSGITSEITFNEGDTTSKMSDQELISHVADSLDEREIIRKEDVIYSKVLRFKYAYVIHDLEYPDKMGVITSYLKDIGIEICGRFGRFEYLNMDACFERAQKMAAKMSMETF